MMPMSRQTWNEGEKYLALRILFIYVLIFLVYVFPFLSLHYHAKQATPRSVICEQYKKMMETEQHESMHAPHKHHTKPHHRTAVHSIKHNT